MRSLSRWLVVLAPAVVVLGLAELHAHLIGHYQFTGTARFVWTLAYIVGLEVATYAAGLPGDLDSTAGALWTAVVAVVAASLAFSAVQLVVASLLLPRVVVLGSAIALIPVYAAIAVSDQRARQLGTGDDRVVAVLSPDEEASFGRDLATAPERSSVLVSVLHPGEARDEGTLVRAGLQHRAGVLVLGRSAQLDEAVMAQAAELHRSGVRVRTLTLFYDEWLGKLPVSDLEPISLMFDIQELHTPGYNRVKRIVDLSSGVAALVALVVVLPVVWILDQVANPGPLLFRQVRVGKGDKPFTIIKFRTMVVGSDGQNWTVPDDPRVPPAARWLRRFHLDELPQAVNLLRGDLSLVGPRPEQPHYVAELGGKIPYYQVRHLVKPGVTGWAQVKFTYGASVADAIEKLQYEFWYLRHQSPLLDARIVARTLRSVLRVGGQ